MLDLFIIYVASIITFIAFGLDKHLAVYQKSRVPEFVLLLLAVLGGSFGALCGMIFFRHKIQYKYFTITVPVLLAIQLAIVIVLRVF